MSQMGQTRSFGDVTSMSGLPERGQGWREAFKPHDSPGTRPFTPGLSCLKMFSFASSLPRPNEGELVRGMRAAEFTHHVRYGMPTTVMKLAVLVVITNL